MSPVRPWSSMVDSASPESPGKEAPLLIRRRHPGGDLGAGVEPQLVQDAANVAANGALGYEQARSDLLVAQALGDQPCDLCFPLAEQPTSRIVRSRGCNL